MRGSISPNARLGLMVENMNINEDLGIITYINFNIGRGTADADCFGYDVVSEKPRPKEDKVLETITITPEGLETKWRNE